MSELAESAEAAGLDAGRLARAYELLASWADDGTVPGATIAVSRRGVALPAAAFGVARQGTQQTDMTPGGLFLVASVTKPVTAIALLQRVEAGQASLADPVQRYIPEFTGPGKDRIRLEHLLTHTSGLPDMLPDNLTLRARHASLSEFVQRTCRCNLLFDPGSRVSYQSMGTLLAAEVVERLTGHPLRQVFAADIFAPLGMQHTCLGLPAELAGRVVDVVLPDEQVGTNYHWNTPYWRDFGAPWGGMFSTVDDLVRLLQAMVDGGARDGRRILGSLTVRAMLTDCTATMPALSRSDRLLRRWGLGWRLGAWGEFGGPNSFSHGGATGTLVGADPDSGLVCAIFTTRPGAPLGRVTSAVQAAVTD